jgi:hypothetical protein
VVPTNESYNDATCSQPQGIMAVPLVLSFTCTNSQAGCRAKGALQLTQRLTTAGFQAHNCRNIDGTPAINWQQVAVEFGSWQVRTPNQSGSTVWAPS